MSLSDEFIPLFDSQPLSVEKAAQAILTLLDKHYGDGRMHLYSKRHYDREGKRRSIRVCSLEASNPRPYWNGYAKTPMHPDSSKRECSRDESKSNLRHHHIKNNVQFVNGYVLALMYLVVYGMTFEVR